jgi:hypothetical protein
MENETPANLISFIGGSNSCINSQIDIKAILVSFDGMGNSFASGYNFKIGFNG